MSHPPGDPHGEHMLASSSPLGTMNWEAVSKRKDRLQGRGYLLRLGKMVPSWVSSSRATAEVTSPPNCLWFLAVVAVFLGSWPASTCLPAFPPPPSWACHSSARHQEEMPVRRKSHAHWPSPLFSLPPSQHTFTHNQNCDVLRQGDGKAPEIGWPHLRSCGGEQTIFWCGSYMKLNPEHTAADSPWCTPS